MAVRGIAVRWADGCTGLVSAIRKTPLASEILRPEVAERRRVWVEARQSDMANMLERLVFIDETSLKTNLVKTTGWAPVGKRLVNHAPFRSLAHPDLRSLALPMTERSPLGFWTVR